ncbi:flagellar basal body-associated protein FliL [Sulfitobacter sp. HGT1]|uniref:flagellar basal body-associated protein FliL n=1 Tax=Sulfitobacter sp. HGT1 TaxID=2735435 RepID=UPI001592D13A|nr:flagellar basal body-associated protein FliL [Sulfitobacter sp. HGT1]
MKKILPIIFLIISAAIGVAAGKFLRPEHVPEVAETSEEEGQDDHTQHLNPPNQTPRDPNEVVDYVKLNNQFVVPIVEEERVASLIVLSLSIETPDGRQEEILRKEPKLRDSFLQVLFTHANLGGFDGEFTRADKLNSLRRLLLEVAQRDVGKDAAYDVLILEIARQDY